MSVSDMRKKFKTECHKSGYDHQRFSEGVNGISVKLIDFPRNPYKSLYTMALSTWGHNIDKWPDASPEERFFVVMQVLFRNTLPLGLEAPKFTFAIDGCSRAAFDQIARLRIGAAFAAMGIRDNSHYNFPFRIPHFLAENDAGLVKKIKKHIGEASDLYKEIVEKWKGSYQAARCILPMGMEYKFSMTINYMALMSFCAKRLSFCEQEDTVAVAWSIKKEIDSNFPLLGDFLMPACDHAGKCLYANKYKMSHLFGELFKPCGRHKDEQEEESEFNHACSDKQAIADQLGMIILNDYSSITDAHRIAMQKIEKADTRHQDDMLNEYLTTQMSQLDWRLFDED